MVTFFALDGHHPCLGGHHPQGVEWLTCSSTPVAVCVLDACCTTGRVDTARHVVAIIESLAWQDRLAAAWTCCAFTYCFGFGCLRFTIVLAVVATLAEVAAFGCECALAFALVFNAVGAALHELVTSRFTAVFWRSHAILRLSPRIMRPTCDCDVPKVLAILLRVSPCSAISRMFLTSSFVR